MNPTNGWRRVLWKDSGYRKKLDAKMVETVPSDPDKKLGRDLSMVEGYDRMTVHWRIYFHCRE
jgi:hypothetical protein